MRMVLGVGILWALCAGFALGIFARSLWVLPEFFLLGSIGLAIFSMVLFSNSRYLRHAIVFGVFMIACGSGILRMQGAILRGDTALDQRLGTRAVFEGVVSDAPDERATQVRVPVRVLAFADVHASTTEATHDHVYALVVFPSHTQLHYGERIRFNGTLRVPQSFDAGIGRSFNYPGYLAAQGITYEIDRAELVERNGFEGNPVVASAYRIKELFVQGLAQSLPEPSAGLAGGITVGDKRAMGKDLTEEFRAVSLVHIVVLSGYNITVVISWLFRVLSSTPRAVRFGTGGLVAIFFAVMTGFASASLRAALMAVIAITGTLSGRIYRAERALALVGVAMLVWNPYLLVFDPGFQLSFLATIGLILFSPIAERYFMRVPEWVGIKEILISSVSAQTAVLPLLLYQSGSLSLVSLPANLLALIVVPQAMFFSLIAAVAGLAAPLLAPLFGFPAYALLSYILAVAHFFAQIPFATIPIPAFSAWILVPIYAVLFGYGLYYARAYNEKTAP